MIEIDRAGDRLRVRTRPSPSYRVATWGVWVAAIAAISIVDRPFGLESATASALLGTPFLVGFGLLLGWTTTECHFDRLTSLLIVSRTRPMLGTRLLKVPFGSVSALVERPVVGGRRLELVLTDESTVVVARADDPTGAVLGSVAREVSHWLDKPVRLAAGSVVAERFEIERFAAQGGMGVVYRAKDRTTSEAVALKLMLASSAEHSLAERFAREMRLLASLEHPGIARYVSSGTGAGDHAYLAMEWLDGEDLAKLLERGALSLEQSVTLLKTVARAAAAAHAQGIVHRDIKPSNLFLRNGSVSDAVLLDFGVARRLDAGTLLTGARAIVGTPHYMAPEQAINTPQLTAAADVFSLGCIFYECLTGQRPFAAEHSVGVLARILYDQPEPISVVQRSVPDAWSKLGMRLLAKDPTARPADGAVLFEEILQLEAARTPPPFHSLPPAVERPRDSGAIDQVFVSVVLATLPPRRPDERVARPVEALRSAIHRFGCPIEQLADGSILATVLPRASAADQVRIAARCALHLREQLPDARIAVATGYAPFGAGPQVGAAADRAAHLLEPTIAHEGIRLDTVSARLLDQHFTTLDQFGAITLVGERTDLDETRPLLGKPTPCVGRSTELGQLEAVLSSAIEESVPRSAVVLGPPGIGKSRLRHELLRRIRERHPTSLPLVGFGDPLSTGSPYVLVSDALRRHAGVHVGAAPSAARARIVELCSQIAPDQRRRVSEFLGELCSVTFANEDNPPLLAAHADHRVMHEQITLAFTDWLAAECAAHPVVLVLEDVQWGDALTVKLVQAALRDIPRGALFVIAFGRPETEHTFPGLFSGHAVSLTLRPLSTTASEALAKGVLGDEVAADQIARIVELAAGNALFLEELIRATAAGKTHGAPETVLAMLQARLSQLAPEPRALLRAASVLGETFWRGGVARICERWGGLEAVDTWIERLVEDEVIARHRTSRYPGDSQYMFRHALLCDAARGLLTEHDLRAAHLDAAAWLEAVGEEDRIVLARHNEDGGERERAIEYYLRAAEQSLEQCDSAEAVSRAARALACGAAGEVSGQLYAVQTAGYFNLGEWENAARVGLAALDLVPRGGAAWCSVVEALTQVLPNVGQAERGSELAAELLQITPAPELRAQYLRTVHVQLMGYALTGRHAEGRACLAFLDAQPDSEPDVLTRGYSKLWRAVYLTLLGDDPLLACRLARAAQQDLATSRVMYRLSLAHTVEAFASWACGDLAAAARAAREGHAIAQEIRDDYHAALALWYLGLALSESDDRATRAEVEQLGRTTVELQASPIFVATAQNLTARAALFDGDWARAEDYGRRSHDGMIGLPAYQFIAASTMITALLRIGKIGEAAASARAEIAILDAMDGPVCSDIMLRVAAAEALFGAGEQAAARTILEKALADIEVRAAKMDDPALARTFREGREENRRAAAFAGEWSGAKTG